MGSERTLTWRLLGNRPLGTESSLSIAIAESKAKGESFERKGSERCVYWLFLSCRTPRFGRAPRALAPVVILLSWQLTATISACLHPHTLPRRRPISSSRSSSA
jgi:hypothetical protein